MLRSGFVDCLVDSCAALLVGSIARQFLETLHGPTVFLIVRFDDLRSMHLGHGQQHG